MTLMIKRLIYCILFFLVWNNSIYSQNDTYWQQHVDYTMKIDFDVVKGSYKGTQNLIYTNNSPDTLNKVYYHLYFNAFQPGSMMDIRARNLIDPERNMEKCIHNLKPNQIGRVNVYSLIQDGEKVDFEIIGTILKVNLKYPVLPGKSTAFDMIYDVQVPKLCRRSGKDNEQGLDYSMGQWYPKLVEYDELGWHPNPYIAREFHGVWGDFDITIDIDSSFQIAAGANHVEYQYLENGKNRWHLRADNVIDFVWAADRNYSSYSLQADSLTVFNFYYQDTINRESTWKLAGPIMVEAFKFMNKRYGRYQYDVYNFIEGGDGGMEYPLATLVRGNRGLNSLVGIFVHEFMHSWYQMQLATNESLYPWMDEGFTSFATIEVLNHLVSKNLIDREFSEFPFDKDYEDYENYLKSRYFEPLNVHSDHFNTNWAYYRAAYTGGVVFLKQLEYVIGKEAFDKGLLLYFDKWKFKHPTPNDFIKVMEKVSDIELDWYLNNFVGTRKFIDYGIDTIYRSENNSIISLENYGTMSMPIDVEILLNDGERKYFTIPRTIMYNNKRHDIYDLEVKKPWAWVNPKYDLKIEVDLKSIKSITIDPSLRMLDLDKTNNVRNLIDE